MGIVSFKYFSVRLPGTIRNFGVLVCPLETAALDPDW